MDANTIRTAEISLVGRGSEQLYDFDEGVGLYGPNIWLHQYARRAAVYRVNKVKRILRPNLVTISRAKPRDQATRQTHGSARVSA